LFFKGQGKLKFESQNSFPYPLRSQPLPSLAFLFYKIFAIKNSKEFLAKIRSVILDPHKVGNSIKIRGVSHPLKGFYKGLGVVKGEG
ncbi:hypothetical protein, partial [Campylobacter porcelli]|uniref:hypothetical protein n=2 Tax=Campylobacter porcelli TaxID=1660073 RepID=UPI001F1A68EC